MILDALRYLLPIMVIGVSAFLVYRWLRNQNASSEELEGSLEPANDENVDYQHVTQTSEPTEPASSSPLEFNFDSTDIAPSLDDSLSDEASPDDIPKAEIEPEDIEVVTELDEPQENSQSPAETSATDEEYDEPVDVHVSEATAESSHSGVSANEQNSAMDILSPENDHPTEMSPHSEEDQNQNPNSPEFDPSSSFEFELPADLTPPEVNQNLPPRRSGRKSQVTPPPTNQPTSPPNDGSKSIPPRRPRAVQQSPTPQPSAPPTIPHTDSPPSSIPPRRSKVVPVPASDAVIEKLQVPPQQDIDDGSISEMRAALESSQQQLRQATAAQHDASSIAEERERDLLRIQKQLDEYERQQHQLQLERESLSKLVTELESNKNSLQADLTNARDQNASLSQQLSNSPSPEALSKLKATHEATVDELRTLLAQHEAAQASLQRERDNLTDVNAELERRLDQFNMKAGPAVAESRVTELEQRQQQLSGEISLANETIRQLNQNLSQRDAELIGFRKEKSSLTAQLDEVTAKLEESDALREQLNEIDAHRGELKKQLETLQDTVDANQRVGEESHQTLEDLARERDDVAQRLETTKHDLMQERAARAELQAQQEEQTRKQEELQLQINATNAQLAATAVADEDQIKKLTAERDQALTDLDAAKQSLAAERSASQNSQQRLVDADEKHQQIAQQLDISNQDLGHLQQAVRERDERLTSAIYDRDQATAALEIAKADFSAAALNIEELTARLAHAEQGQHAAEKALQEALQAANHNADSERNVENNRLAILVAEREEAEEQSRSVQAKLSKQLGDLQTEIDELRRQNENLDNAKSRLDDQLGAAHEDINAKSHEMKRMRERLLEFEQTAARAKQQQGAWQEAIDERNQASSLLKEKTQQLQTLQAEQIETKRALALLTQESESWQNERQTFLEKLEQHESGRSLQNDAVENDPNEQRQAEFEQAIAAAAEASETIASLMGNVEQLKKRVRDKEDSITRISNDNRLHLEKIKQLQEKANQLEPLERERARDQDSARQRLADATAANAELTAELKKLRDQTSRGDHADASSIEQLAKLNRVIEEQTQTISKRDGRLADLASELSDVRSEAKELRSQLKEQKAVVRAMGGSAGSTTKKTKKGSTTAKTNGNATASRKAKTTRTARTIKTDKGIGTIFRTRPKSVDDLKQIAGIGPAIEKRLNAAGIYQFEQIAGWSTANAKSIDEQLSLGGRIARDKWTVQARKLSKRKTK